MEGGRDGYHRGQHATNFQAFAACLIQTAGVEPDARLGVHEGGDGTKEEHAIGLARDIGWNVGGWIVAGHQPAQQGGHSLKVGLAETLHADGVRVAQGPHNFHKVCRVLPVRVRGERRYRGWRGGDWKLETKKKKKKIIGVVRPHLRDISAHPTPSMGPEKMVGNQGMKRGR